MCHFESFDIIKIGLSSIFDFFLKKCISIDYLPIHNKNQNCYFFIEKRNKYINLFLQHFKENTWEKNSIPYKFSISSSVLFQMSSAVKEIIESILAIV